MPQETIENIDELELLLSDLADLEGLEELDEEPAPIKAEEPAPAPKQEDVEPDADDVEMLLSGLENSEASVAAEETQPEPEPEPEPELDEVEALLEAAAEPTPEPTPVVKDRNEDAFVPESNLRTFIDPDKLKADLDFTETNISNAMTRQAPLFAHYSTLAHQAQFQADRAEQQVELIEAQLDQKYRDAFATAGTKVTENVIRASIIKDDRYQKAMLRKHEANAIAQMVKSAADSFRHRKDMLIQVGADLRQEAQGGVRMKESQHPGKAALSLLNQA